MGAYGVPLILPNNTKINGVEHFYQTTKPTTRGDGSALVAGDRWWKIDDGTEWFWNGTYWLSSTKQIFKVYLQYDGLNAVADTDVNRFFLLNDFYLENITLTMRVAPTGSAFVVDVNDDGTSILSTKLTIDAGETSSTTAVPYVLTADPTVIAAGSLLTFDVDQVGSTIAGSGSQLDIEGREVAP